MAGSDQDFSGKEPGGDVPGQEGEMAAAAPNARMFGHTVRVNLGLRIIVFLLLGAL
jgi:hypothetical protein